MVDERADELDRQPARPPDAQRRRAALGGLGDGAAAVERAQARRPHLPRRLHAAPAHRRAPHYSVWLRDTE